jgi:hypothetical protein
MAAGRAVATNGAFRPAGRAAGVADHRIVVGRREIDRPRLADASRRVAQVAAEIGRPQRKHLLQAIGRPRGELAAALAMRGRIDDQRARLCVLDHFEMVAERRQRMQPRADDAQPLRRRSGAPRLGAVGAQERDRLALAQSDGCHCRLQATDHRQGAAIGEAAAIPGEGHAFRETRECPQHQRRAGGRLGNRGIHVVPPVRYRSAQGAGCTVIQWRAISSRVATQTLGLAPT